MNLIPFFAAFFIIGLAELGDKTQLLVLTLAAKYPMDKVIYGVTAATATLMLIAVLVGEAIQKLFPPLLIGVVAGAFFIIYGLSMIRPISNKDDEEKDDKPINATDPFWIVFGSFFLAELGDKTQLATFAIAARYAAPVQVWFGATLGMMVVNLFGIAIGNMLRNYLPERIMTKAAGALFILFGLLTFIGMMLRI